MVLGAPGRVFFLPKPPCAKLAKHTITTFKDHLLLPQGLTLKKFLCLVFPPKITKKPESLLYYLFFLLGKLTKYDETLGKTRVFPLKTLKKTAYLPSEVVFFVFFGRHPSLGRSRQIALQSRL